MALPSAAAVLPPDLRRAIGGLQAATDEAAQKTVPPTKFGPDAVNDLIDAINSGIMLFGPKGKRIAPVTRPGTIPVEVMKFLVMLDKVAMDLGREPLSDELDDALDDTRLSMFAGLVQSFLNDAEVRAYLRSPARDSEPLVPSKPMPAPGPSMPAPESTPTDKLKKLAFSRGV